MLTLWKVFIIVCSPKGVVSGTDTSCVLNLQLRQKMGFCKIIIRIATAI